MKEAIITLKNGQVVGYAEYGAADGIPMFSFHGTPGSRMVSSVYDATARAAGIRLIAPERPGYGKSSPAQNSSLLDYPDQIAEIADSLGIERFAVVGASGGGLYSAACAYKLADRVTVAGLISVMMPLYLPDTMRGMATPNSVFFTLARFSPGFAGFLIRRLTLASLGSAEQHLKNGTSPIADITPEAYAIVISDIRGAFEGGAAGIKLDMVNLWRRLEFQLEDIRVPVHLWHGEADNLAPVTCGRYAAARIPNCQATFYPGESHTGPLLNHGAEIMQALAAAATAT